MFRCISSLIYEISNNLKTYKLKKFSDKVFIFIEKILLNFPIFHKFYLDIYDNMTDNEINLANISKDNIVLHIGCGSLPATCILLSKKIGAHIIGLDHDLKSVKQAKLCISKYNLDDKIQIEFSDAKDFAVEKFDVILLSQGIKPQNEILNHIANSIKNNTKVVFRSTYDKKNKLSENDMFLKDIFIVEKIVHHKENGPLISILLSKK